MYHNSGKPAYNDDSGDTKTEANVRITAAELQDRRTGTDDAR
jgi:hypothetical protein